MSRIVIELTNRCNLSCLHCFDERHAATGDLAMEILDTVLLEGKACGIDHVCFTGGEPTIHRGFHEIIRRVSAAGYTFSFVTNGMNFLQIYPLLIRYRTWFQGLTFSLDGAREHTHDQLRGAGSYRRVMRAASICVVKDLPFTFNMVLTVRNRGEVDEMVGLAGQLGSGGVRFGHLMFTSDTVSRELNLSPQERREVEAEIWRLQKSAPISVGMAPGYFSEAPFFPCGPLKLEEYNLDYRGNLTLCCQLSGYAGENSEADSMGNLHEISLSRACEQFHQRVATYLADKQDTIRKGEFTELDHFPCWYCVNYLKKVPSGHNFPPPSWEQTDGRGRGEQINVQFEFNGSAAS